MWPDRDHVSLGEPQGLSFAPLSPLSHATARPFTRKGRKAIHGVAHGHPPPALVLISLPFGLSDKSPFQLFSWLGIWAPRRGHALRLTTWCWAQRVACSLWLRP